MTLHANFAICLKLKSSLQSHLAIKISTKSRVRITLGQCRSLRHNRRTETADRQSHRYTSNAYGILTLSGSRAAGILLEGQSPKRCGYYITDVMKVGKTILG